jgi:hypothetical protein
VPDGLIGKLVKCPTCDKTFTATAEMTKAEAAEAAPPEQKPAPSPVGYEVEPPISQAPPRLRSREGRDAFESEEHEQEPRPRRAKRRLDLRPHRGTMILVFGILSIVLGCPIGFVFGPMAWVMGKNDLAEIRSGRMDPEGEGSTNSGRICGIIGTILSVLGFCCGAIGTLFWVLGAAGAAHHGF